MLSTDSHIITNDGRGTRVMTMTPDNVGQFAGLTVTKARGALADPLFIMLYGTGGSGKTSLAASISKSKHAGKVLHVDIEGGSGSIAHYEDIDVVHPQSWKEIDSVLKAIDSDKCPYGTVIFDNVSEAANMHLKQVVGVDAPQIQHFGQNTGVMLGWFRELRKIGQKRNINIIFVAWSTIEKEEYTGRFHNRVFFTPKLAQQIPGIVTIVGQVLTVRKQPNYRMLNFVADDATDAKFRVAPTEYAADIPLEIYYKRDDNLLADIIDTFRGDKKWPKEKYLKPSGKE